MGPSESAPAGQPRPASLLPRPVTHTPRCLAPSRARVNARRSAAFLGTLCTSRRPLQGSQPDDDDSRGVVTQFLPEQVEDVRANGPFPTEPEEARRPFAGESPYESIGDPSDTGDHGGRSTDTCLLPGVASLVCDGDGTVRIRGTAPDRLPSGLRRCPGWCPVEPDPVRVSGAVGPGLTSRSASQVFSGGAPRPF